MYQTKCYRTKYTRQYIQDKIYRNMDQHAPPHTTTQHLAAAIPFCTTLQYTTLQRTATYHRTPTSSPPSATTLNNTPDTAPSCTTLQLPRNDYHLPPPNRLEHIVDDLQERHLRWMNFPVCRMETAEAIGWYWPCQVQTLTASTLLMVFTSAESSRMILALPSTDAHCKHLADGIYVCNWLGQFY